MDATIMLKRFRAYQRGYTDAAGARPIDDVQRAKHVHEYDLGWDKGQADRQKALRDHSEELGILVRTVQTWEQFPPET